MKTIVQTTTYADNKTSKTRLRTGVRRQAFQAVHPAIIPQLCHMTEQDWLDTIPPRWISITQAMQYAPALGRKKIVGHIRKENFYGYMDGGEWVIDRLTMDAYFEKQKRAREERIAAGLAKVSGL